MQISCTEQCFVTALAISKLSSILAQPRKWGCQKCPVQAIQCSWRTPGVSAASPSVDRTPLWTEMCPCWTCPCHHWAAVLEQNWGQWLAEGGERVWPGPVELKARAAYPSPTPLDPPMLISDHGPSHHP